MIPSGLLVDGPRGQTESKVHSHDTSDPKSLQFCSNEELD